MYLDTNTEEPLSPKNPDFINNKNIIHIKSSIKHINTIQNKPNIMNEDDDLSDVNEYNKKISKEFKRHSRKSSSIKRKFNL